MIPMRSDLVLSKAQTWKVIMFTQGDVLRLKEGVDLSSGNSFFTQPERTNPRVSSGIWLAAFIALLVRLLSPAGSGWVMGAGAQLPKCFLRLFVVMSVLRSCRLSGWKTGLCGSNPSYRFDLWVLAWGFFSLFLFQLWSNKSFPELTHKGPKNRNAASTAAPAKPTDSPSRGRKHPQVSATEANTWGEEPMWFEDYIAG